MSSRWLSDRRLRVALVHSYYSSKQPSGENRVVEQQAAALAGAGHIVEIMSQRTDDREASRGYRPMVAITVASGLGPAPLDKISEFRPDIVHVHNLFPNYGRTWLRRNKVPLVATMHNYRPLCPAATFFRDGRLCTKCLDAKTAVPAVRHGCYRSRLQTVPVALATKFSDDPVLTNADKIVVINDRMKDLYTSAGVSSDRISVVPNFVPASDVPPVGSGGDYWLYVGRLSAEKGILNIVRSWPDDHRLVVAGTGGEEAAVRAVASASVNVLGAVTSSEVRSLMAHAVGLIFPSRSMEGLALVCLEALAAGTPILAWEPTEAASAVAAWGVGAVAGTDLAGSLLQAAELFPSLRNHCREVFDERFTEEKWLEKTTALYHDAIASRQ